MTYKNPPLKVTVITGFLGSGKTTLLNNILSTGFQDQRIAVIVNDFGKISVDSALINVAEKNMITLKNGCVCCTLMGDLAQTFSKLLAQQDNIDHLFIETSGITRIASLQSVFQHDDFKNQLNLERIVVVANAKIYAQACEKFPVIQEQTNHADLVLLNRCDTATDEQIENAEKQIQKINQAVEIIRTVNCKFEIEKLILSKNKTKDLSDLKSIEPEKWFRSTLEFIQPVDENQLHLIFENLPNHILRIKGIIPAPDQTHWLVQCVTDEVKISKATTEQIKKSESGKLMIIGSESLNDWLAITTEKFPAILKNPQKNIEHKH